MALFLILCVFPTFTVIGATNGVVIRNGGKCLTYMIYLYMIGGYIKKYNDKDYNRLKLITGYAVSMCIIFLLNTLVTLYVNKQCLVFGYDCSPITLFSSLCIFYLFKSWSFHNNTINWLASSVFAFYLLSNIYFFVDSRFINLKDLSGSNRFVLYLFVLIGVSWVFSLLIDKTLGQLITKLIKKSIERIKPRIENNKIVYNLLRKYNNE